MAEVDNVYHRPFKISHVEYQHPPCEDHDHKCPPQVVSHHQSWLKIFCSYFWLLPGPTSIGTYSAHLFRYVLVKQQNFPESILTLVLEDV